MVGVLNNFLKTPLPLLKLYNLSSGFNSFKRSTQFSQDFTRNPFQILSMISPVIHSTIPPGLCHGFLHFCFLWSSVGNPYRNFSRHSIKDFFPRDFIWDSFADYNQDYIRESSGIPSGIPPGVPPRIPLVISSLNCSQSSFRVISVILTGIPSRIFFSNSF